jgi:hypothetical protein
VQRSFWTRRTFVTPDLAREGGHQDSRSPLDKFSATASAARRENVYVEEIFRSRSGDRRILLDEEIAEAHE